MPDDRPKEGAQSTAAPLLCWFLGHVARPVVTDETADMVEPGKATRKVVIRMAVTSCLRCGARLSIRPCGVVRDPA